MLDEATDFRDESLALYRLLAPLADTDFATPTAFKQWTLNDILAHLHFFNMLADDSLVDEARFDATLARFQAARLKPGGTMRSATDLLLGGLSGRALLNAWRDYLDTMTPRWQAADARQRLKWVGPTMSVRSSMTARLMETWAHAQAIYDLFAVERIEDDRIRSIAVLGVNTFGWTFGNRQLDIPAQRPHLVLTAPSGALWQWHEPDARAVQAHAAAGGDDAGDIGVTSSGLAQTDRIEGPAAAFCQVVTQVRHVADTDLVVTGETARQWMAIAQCFAGPPNDPPAPGSRRRATTPPRFARDPEANT